jgi:hypothetical protein
MTVFRPTQMESPALLPETALRRSGRDFSDAEAVVLLYRDSPSQADEVIRQ